MIIPEQTLTAECLAELADDVTYTSSSDNAPPEYFARHEAMTRVFGFILFVLFTPVMALLIVMVRCTSRGPAIYKQARVGRNGTPFTMYKFRTMRNDAEALTGPVWSTTNDPRITRLGALLRFLHLDELPQLWNVARGDMNLIGPRPERPEITENLVEVIPRYAERLAVKPGITGIAQINLPPDSDYESVVRKLYLDFHYIDKASVSLDLRILLCTASRLFAIRHGRAVSIFRLQKHVPDSVLDMIRPDAREADRVCKLLGATVGGCEDDANELRHRAR